MGAFAFLVTGALIGEFSYYFLFEGRNPFIALFFGDERSRLLYKDVWIFGPFRVAPWILLQTAIGIIMVMVTILLIVIKGSREIITKYPVQCLLVILISVLSYYFIKSLGFVDGYIVLLLQLIVVLSFAGLKVGIDNFRTEEATKTRSDGGIEKSNKNDFKISLFCILIITLGVLFGNVWTYFLSILFPIFCWGYLLRKEGQFINHYVVICLTVVAYLAVSIRFYTFAFSTPGADVIGFNPVTGSLAGFSTDPVAAISNATNMFNILLNAIRDGRFFIVFIAIYDVTIHVLPSVVISLNLVRFFITWARPDGDVSKPLFGIVGGLIAMGAAAFIDYVMSTVTSGGYLFSSQSMRRLGIPFAVIAGATNAPIMDFFYGYVFSLPFFFWIGTIVFTIVFYFRSDWIRTELPPTKQEMVNLKESEEDKFETVFPALIIVIITFFIYLSMALTSLATNTIPKEIFWMIGFGILSGIYCAVIYAGIPQKIGISQKWDSTALIGGLMGLAIAEFGSITLMYFFEYSTAPSESAWMEIIYVVLLIPPHETYTFFGLIMVLITFAIVRYVLKGKEIRTFEAEKKVLEVEKKAKVERYENLQDKIIASNKGRLEKTILLSFIDKDIRRVNRNFQKNIIKREKTVYNYPWIYVRMILFLMGIFTAFIFSYYHYFASGLDFPVWARTFFYYFLLGGIAFFIVIIATRNFNAAVLAHVFVNMLFYIT